MKRYVTEFIGTFFLVLTVCLTAGAGSPFAPVAIGAALMVMVYMGGPISGAHYNPAVSIAALLCRKLPGPDLVPYFVAQLAGAVAAAVVGDWVLGNPFAPAPAPTSTIFQVLAVEFFYTFALCLVVLNVATSKRTAGNSYFGLAIGFTITAGAFAGGPASGGAFNPAVGLGPILVAAVVAKGSLANAWFYVVGPILGAVAASRVFEMQESGA
ncbi:MAG TPA: aquaporin [Candidatus Eisenbacteria bacterium]|jgi:aquaporin Z